MVHILEFESAWVAALAGAELVGWKLPQAETKEAESMTRQIEAFIALPFGSNNNPLELSRPNEACAIALWSYRATRAYRPRQGAI